MIKSIQTKFVLGIILFTLLVFFSLASLALADGVETTASPTTTQAPTDPENGNGDFDGGLGDGLIDGIFDSEGNGEEENIEEIAGIDTEDGYVVDINYDKPNTFRVRSGGSCKVIDKITIETNEAVSGTLTINALNNDEVDEEFSKVGFCRIELDGIESEQIENVKWRVRVNRDMLMDKGYDRDALKLIVWEGEEILKSRLQRIDGDSDNYIYTTDTDTLGDGRVGVIMEEDGIFTLRNLIICLGGLLAVALVASGIYALMYREEKDVSEYEGETKSSDKGKTRSKKIDL